MKTLLITLILLFSYNTNANECAEKDMEKYKTLIVEKLEKMPAGKWRLGDEMFKRIKVRVGRYYLKINENGYLYINDESIDVSELLHERLKIVYDRARCQLEGTQYRLIKRVLRMLQDG